jgi:hypothetical protein
MLENGSPDCNEEKLWKGHKTGECSEGRVNRDIAENTTHKHLNDL